MAKKTAKEVVQDTVAEVKKASVQTKEAVEGAVNSAKKNVKEKVENDPAVAEKIKDTKDAVDKVVESTKATAKKVTAPKFKEVYIQYEGKEVKETELMAQILEKYLADGNKRTTFKNVELYVKPEENAAYYVINGSTSGKIEL